MRRSLALGATAALALATSDLTFAQNTPANLQIHWIDTEGGAATLIVTPAGESFLIDTGYPNADRDAKRIVAAAQRAGVSKIDHALISHFHNDHVGGLAALAKMIPINKFYDHGDTVDQVDKKRLDDYKLLVGGKREIVKPGDQIQLKGGVHVLVIASDAKFIDKPVNGGGPNPLCADAAQMTPAGGENQRTIGVLRDVQQLHVPQHDRSRLGDGDGTCVPAQQGRHGDGLSERPPWRGRWRKCTRVHWSHQAAGLGREQRSAQGLWGIGRPH